jgi:hypothetical protein
MKLPFFYSVLAALAVTFAVGCGGDDAAKVTAANLKAFESASAEVKQTWQTALAASQTNGYVAAITSLRDLAGKDLTLEQVEAVQSAMRAINTKLTDAVASGNAEALKAQEALRAGAVRR